MKKLNFKRVFPLFLLALTASFAGCNSEDVDFSTAALSLTPTSKTLSFNADGTPVDSDTFTIHTNRSWSITGEGSIDLWEVVHENNEDFSWIGLSRSEGSGSADISVILLPNTGETRSVRLKISASINQEHVTITQTGAIETRLLYNIKFGQDAAFSSPYEYLDEWLAAGKDLMESGEGASTAEVEGSSVSLRQSGRLSSDYIGASAKNKLFFSANSSFTIKTISSFGASRFKITFGIAHYSNEVNDFSYNKMSVEVSADGTTYVPVTYTASTDPVSGSAAPDWYFCTGYVDIATTNYVYVRFVANVDSALSLDDVTVSSITGSTPSGPQVITAAATNITATSATVGGSYTPADATPSALGIEYKKGSEPYVRQAVSGSVQTPFTVDLTGLTNGVTYTYRAYATFDGTTTYGSELTFTAGGTDPGVTEFFNEDFGQVDAVPSSNPKVGEYTGYTMTSPIVYSDPYGTWADIRTTSSMLSTYNMHLWLPVYNTDRESGLRIEGIASGFTSMTLSYDIATNTANSNIQQIKIRCNGTDIAVPDIVLERYNEFTNASIDIPDGTTTIEFYSGVDNIGGFRIDNIKISGASGGGGTTFSFGQATFSGSLVKDTAISGAMITAPYYNASGQSYSGVSVAVSGAGSAGISVTQQSSVTLSSGNGSVDFTVTGTPTTAGAVTFTISGISDLTGTNAVASTTVTEGAGSGNQFFYEDFGHVDAVPSSNSKVGVYTGYTMTSPIVYSDPYGTWADIRTTSSMLATYNMHLWLPVHNTDRESGIFIQGIESGYTNMQLLYDIATNAANTNVNQIKVKCNGTEVTVPSTVLERYNEFTTITIDIPNGTTSVEFYSGPENTGGFRIDNIKINGTK